MRRLHLKRNSIASPGNGLILSTTLSLVLLLCGCAAPTPPEWIYTAEHSSSVCGDGEGESQQEAKMKSIASMTHAIGVNVKAVHEQQRSYDGKSLHVNLSESSRVENLFPTLVQLSTTRYEVRNNWWNERHYLRSCVSYGSIANAVEESLKGDVAVLKKTNQTVECLSHAQRDDYDARKEKIESKLSLLRTYRPQSEMIQIVSDVGYQTTKRGGIDVHGDALLVIPFISREGIVVSTSGGIMEVITVREFQNDPTAKKANPSYLCVLRTHIRLTNSCDELIYEKEFKCVDAGKTKKVSEINARTKMIRLLGQSDLIEALKRY